MIATTTIVADEGMSGGQETGSKNILRKRVLVIKIFQNLGAKYVIFKTLISSVTTFLIITCYWKQHSSNKEK